jgi:hypothetical protein
MQARTKIQCDAIGRAQKLLETAPVAPIEEVTKSNAVRILIPQIRDARSKGYSVDAIAKMLSESGVPASASLIKALLSEVGSQFLSGPHSASGPSRRRKAPPPGVRPSPRQEPSATASPSQDLTRTGLAATPDRSGVQDGTEGNATPASKAPPAGLPVARRSAFVPRPDTEDI